VRWHHGRLEGSVSEIEEKGTDSSLRSERQWFFVRYSLGMSLAENLSSGAEGLTFCMVFATAKTVP
jgi:hypothetical protein